MGGVVFKSAPTFFPHIAVSSSPSTVIHLKRSHELIKSRNERITFIWFACLAWAKFTFWKGIENNAVVMKKTKKEARQFETDFFSKRGRRGMYSIWNTGGIPHDCTYTIAWTAEAMQEGKTKSLYYFSYFSVFGALSTDILTTIWQRETPIFAPNRTYKKKMKKTKNTDNVDVFCIFRLDLIWCRWRGSNPHAREGNRFWVCHVCQFHHIGTSK